MTDSIRFFFVKRSPSGELRFLGRIIQGGGGIDVESYYKGAWHPESSFMRYLTDPYGVDEVEEAELGPYMAQMDQKG